MASRRLRLHDRIVIPFVLIAIVVPTVAAFVSLSLVIGSLEGRFDMQVLNTAAVVSRSDFALNPSILTKVKDITGTDVITYTTGSPGHSTRCSTASMARRMRWGGRAA